MKIIALTIALMVSALSVCGQTRVPKWVTTTPAPTKTAVKAVGQGATLEEARHNAINILIGGTTKTPEDNSFQKRLLDSGREPIAQHTALVKAAEQSLFFPTKDKFMNDEGCWVLCEMTTTGLKNFSDSLYTAISALAWSKVRDGRKLQTGGDLLAAAQTYSEALQEVIPMVHKPLTCPEGDLMELLHDGYVHCLDSISVKFDLHESAMICGEEIPRDLLVSAACKGQPVSALPLTFSIDPVGSLAEHAITDGKGRGKTRIIQAPQAQKAFLYVTANLQQMISGLPQNIFSSELSQQIAQCPIGDELVLTAFDPTPTYHLQPLAEGDGSCLADSLKALMKRIKYQPEEQPADADVLLTHAFTYEPEGEASTGKYPMQYFVCSLAITATDRRTQQELAKVEKAGLRLFLKSDVTPDQIQTLATNELYHRLRHQMKKLSNMNFDKRNVIFGTH